MVLFFVAFIFIVSNLVVVDSLFIPNIDVRSDYSKNTEYFKVNSTFIPGYESAWDDKLSMYAGHISVTNDESSLFFWSFKSPVVIDEENEKEKEEEKQNIKKPLIIWLNGGPGCSSMDGALMEIGPLRVKDSNSIVWNEGWFDKADLLFIDQPIGTGFSLKDKQDSFDSNLVESSNHLLKFIDNYFEIFQSDYQYYDEIIIAGESYAGQYIPHFTKLLKDSDKYQNKISAIMLGNAWLDPNLQSLSYIPFLLDNKLIDLTDNKQSEKFSELLTNQDKCQNIRNSVKGKLKFSDDICDTILINFLKFFRKDHKCVNIYDINKIDSYPSCGNNWPEILHDSTKFLNNENVQSALNINNFNNHSIEWKECNNNVNSHFKPNSDSLMGASLLHELLNNGIKVNLFSGTSDLICNYLSTEMVIKEHLSNYLIENNLTITIDQPKIYKRSIEKFKMDYLWSHDNKIDGAYWKRGNLTYVKIDNASHMVAYDSSKSSIGLIDLTLRDDLEIINGREIKTYTPGNESKLKEIEIPKPNNSSNNNSSSNSHNYEISKKSLAILILLLVSILLAVYYYRLWYKKPTRYSALAGAPSSRNYRNSYANWVVSKNFNKSMKKKRVHWMDLEELDNEDQQQSSSNEILNKFKSFEMEDLNFDLESGEPFNNRNSESEHENLKDTNLKDTQIFEIEQSENLPKIIL